MSPEETQTMSHVVQKQTNIQKLQPKAVLPALPDTSGSLNPRLRLLDPPLLDPENSPQALNPKP